MRFQVGERVLFCELESVKALDSTQLACVVNDEKQLWEKMPLHPDNPCKLWRIEFHYLVCVGHQCVDTVVSSQSNSQLGSVCDGYIFRHTNGGFWYNQYPLSRPEKLEPAGDCIINEVADYGRMFAVKQGLDYIRARERGLKTYLEAIPWSPRQRQESREKENLQKWDKACKDYELVRQFQYRIVEELQTQLNLHPSQL
jgi:hypothetical protein